MLVDPDLEVGVFICSKQKISKVKITICNMNNQGEIKKKQKLKLKLIEIYI